MAKFSWNPSHWLTFLLLALSAAPSIAADRARPAVVLVHGIYDRGTKMQWLARRFEAAGYETFCPTLVPSDGSVSLAVSAAHLNEAVIARFGVDRPLHVVGFSMGGLISRYWIAHFPVRSRVKSFATISSPHHGTWTACFHSLPDVVEMRPGSVFLRELEKNDELFSSLHPFSIFTPLDLMILPARSSRWAVARTEIHWCLLHPLMVFSPQVAGKLLQNMRLAEKG